MFTIESVRLSFLEFYPLSISQEMYSRVLLLRGFATKTPASTSSSAKSDRKAMTQNRTMAQKKSQPLIKSLKPVSATAVPPSEVVCFKCLGKGHLGKDCPNVAVGNTTVEAKSARKLFEEHRCLVCGERGHVARACPVVTGKALPDKSQEVGVESIPVVVVPVALTQEHKMCFQCGSRGHVMKHCPTQASGIKIKGIEMRYSGARLNKQLPLMLRTPVDKSKAWLDVAKEFTSRDLVGTVVSTKTEKTIGVALEWTAYHEKLNYEYNRVRKYLVHDEKELAQCGDVVRIRPFPKISKTKNFVLVDVMHAIKDKRENAVKSVEEMKAVYASAVSDEMREKIANIDKVRQSYDFQMKNRASFMEDAGKEASSSSAAG